MRANGPKIGAAARTIVRIAVAASIALFGLALGSNPSEAGQKFVYATPAVYDTLDPHAVLDAGRVAPRLNLYDGLLRWEDNPPKLEPWLAEGYEVSPDGLTYRFTLRQGATFHDASPVEASDVVYSIERILALKKGAYSLFEASVAPGSTVAIDARTVEFHLTAPSAAFLAKVPEIHVVNEGLIRSKEVNGDWGQAWLASHDAGSGSYRLNRYDPAIGFNAKRFPEHFLGWNDKYLDEIEFRTIAASDARVLGLIAGDFHGIDGYLTPGEVGRLAVEPNIRLDEQEAMRIFYALIHNARPPMNDVNFRKALSYAFDYDGFIGSVLSGSVTRNPGPLPNTMWGAPAGAAGYGFDLDAAREHLAMVEAPLREITLGAVEGYPQTRQAAAVLQHGLGKIGVEARILSEPWALASARMQHEQQMYDVLFLWRSSHYADPENWIGEMYACDQIGVRNSAWYCNPEVDALLAEARNTADSAVRQSSYEKAAALVMEDA
ncbi:MAG TPA: ABC transporter substrate-binding protein, partial [Thermohalobaculum sp.]|nr:ABC transporter substrate-binding protein [Thermohalobaculum sp.]